MIKFTAQIRKSPSTGEALYYPAVAATTPVKLKEVVSQIEKYCTLSDSDIEAVLLSLEEVVASFLKQGRTVRLGVLGSFRPTLAVKESKEEESQVKASDVSHVRCRFTPSSTLKQCLTLKALSFAKVASGEEGDDSDKG